jgi:hypothetical protein
LNMNDKSNPGEHRVNGNEPRSAVDMPFCARLDAGKLGLYF